MVNGGKTGAGPRFYLHRLQKNAEHINPGLALVGFYIGNDIDEIHREYEDKDGDLCISPDSFTSLMDIAAKKNILGDMNFSNL